MKGLILFLIAGSVLAASPQQIGTVAKVVGKVQRVNASHDMNDYLKVGGKIFKSDEISTARSSFVKVLLKDDTIFQLGANSKFKFEKFVAKKGKKKEATYRLLYGKMRSLFIKQQSDKVMITTPTVSMGVRGTEILSDVYWDKSDKGASLPKTDVALLSGKLEISMTNMPSAKTINLDAGEVFDSNKASLSRIESTKKMPTAVYKKLKSGKSTFLFEARNPSKSFPAMMPKQNKEKIQKPKGDSNAIEAGKRRHVRKHFRKKRTMVAPPPPPVDSTTLRPPTNIDATTPPPPTDPPDGTDPNSNY